MPRAILAQWDQNFSEVYMQKMYKLVVALFLNILKVVFLLLQGGPPLHPPPLRGGTAYRPGDYAKSVGAVGNRTHCNIEVMVGQRMKPKENVSSRLKNIMPGSKKL